MSILLLFVCRSLNSTCAPRRMCRFMNDRSGQLADSRKVVCMHTALADLFRSQSFVFTLHSIPMRFEPSPMNMHDNFYGNATFFHQQTA